MGEEKSENLEKNLFSMAVKKLQPLELRQTKSKAGLSFTISDLSTKDNRISLQV